MSLVGIGLDLIDLERFTSLYGAQDPDVLARCFTPRELGVVGNGTHRIERLAARFAAKEAVLKVIGGLQDGMSLTDIEIGREPDGKPTVVLSGLALSEANARGATQLHLSMTHSAASAAAVVVTVSGGGPT